MLEKHVRFFLSLVFWWAILLLVFLRLDSLVRAEFSVLAAVEGLLWFFFIGWLQYVLVQAMHESCHQYFYKNDALSFLAAVLCTYPVGLTREYRDLHLAHHKHFADSKQDPDFAAYTNVPQTKLQFIALFFKNLSGLPAIMQFFQQRNDGGSKTEFLYLLVTQLLLLAIISLSFSFWLYPFFWLLPIVTVVKAFSQLRILAEHADPQQGIVVRTFRGNALLNFILGPYGFARHAEHHDLMSVVSYKLADVNMPVNDGWLLRTSNQEKVRIYNKNHIHFLVLWFLTLPMQQSPEPLPEMLPGERKLSL